MRSIIAVTEPAETIDLTTLAGVKLDLGITDGASDQRIEKWIAQASGIAVRYCDRPLALEGVTETFRRTGHQREYLWRDSLSSHAAGRSGETNGLRLTRYPIVSVAGVMVDGNVIDPSLYEFDETELYRLTADGHPDAWHFGKSIVVAYRAGYAIPIVAAYADLERAVMSMVRDFRAATFRDDPFLKSRETVGVSRLEWWIPTASTMVLPPEISGLLDPFVRKWGFMA